MNIQSNAAESTLNSQVRAPAKVSETRLLYWSLRRELWESRSLYIAPLGAAVVFLLGFAMTSVHLPDKMRAAALLDPMKQREALALPYDIAAGLLMLTGMVVATFYCLDALYGERRDRSILFWKSLPVSDLITVLTKASVPLVFLPLLIFVITVTTQFIMLVLSSAILAGSGQKCRDAMGPVILLAELVALALPLADGSCALARAPLWLVAAGLGLVPACAVLVGLLASNCHLLSREDHLQYHRFSFAVAGPAEWRHGSASRVGGIPNGPDDTNNSGQIPERSWAVDRLSLHGTVPRCSGPAEALSRTDLIALGHRLSVATPTSSKIPADCL